MHNNLPFEHPQIAMVQETGYPEQEQWQRACPDCDNDIHDGDAVYTINGKEVCGECFAEWLTDYTSTNPREVDNALSVNWRLQQ